MYDANRVLRRLRLCTVRYDHDICLLMLLKCIAICDSLTKSKKWATMMPTFNNSLQLRILTDQSLIFECFRTFANFIIFFLIFELSRT